MHLPIAVFLEIHVLDHNWISMYFKVYKVRLASHISSNNALIHNHVMLFSFYNIKKYSVLLVRNLQNNQESSYNFSRAGHNFSLLFSLVISCINKQIKENAIVWVSEIFDHSEVLCACNTVNLTAVQFSLVSICVELWNRQKLCMHTDTTLGYALGTNEN